MPLPYGLIEPVELGLPELPARLDGFRIGHLTDLHIRRDNGRYDRLASQLTSLRLDLIVLTGDYIDKAGQEKAGHAVLERLLGQVRPRFGIFGVFGNHDTHVLRDRLQSLPVTWLENDWHRLAQIPIELMGLNIIDTHLPDSVQLALRMPERARSGGERPLRLMLSHDPSTLMIAADMGADVVLCGHTHGGQCRLPTGHALVNSCDLPLRVTSGILRHRETLIPISRGLGFTGGIPRIFCRAHVPVYTLRRRTMLGEYCCGIENLRPW